MSWNDNNIRLSFEPASLAILRGLIAVYAALSLIVFIFDSTIRIGASDSYQTITDNNAVAAILPKSPRAYIVAIRSCEPYGEGDAKIFHSLSIGLKLQAII